MDLVSAIAALSGLALVGVTIYAANQEQAQHEAPQLSRWLLYVHVFTMFMLMPAAFLAVTEPELQTPSLLAWLAAALIVPCVALAYGVIVSAGLRRRIQRLIGSAGSYDAQSGVHTTAVVMAILVLLILIVPFILGGGIQGYAEAIQEAPPNLSEPAVLALLQVTAAFLGVGLLIRRSPAQSLARLGLRLPTRQDVLVGAGVGFGLMLLANVFVAVWQALDAERMAEQTRAAEQLVSAYATLPLAFLLALCAAVGEETLIRGALQPVFGIFASSVFFALLHTQHLVTPGLLLIFLISVTFGVVRQRYSTSAAIIAHFVYNFVPLALVIIVGGSV